MSNPTVSSVPAPAAAPVPALEVEHVSVAYGSGPGAVQAVEDVTFRVGRGEIVGLAGESGSGKSTLAYAITRLLRPPARLTRGRIWVDGVDVYALNPIELERFRWARVSIVFQSALNSLNPVLSIGTQIADVIQVHENVSREVAVERAKELLRLVDVDPRRLSSFPHQLSGGQRQRVVIAMALALRPTLVIFDEPTTALDVVVQREILTEVQALQRSLGFSLLFITHDLSLLGEIADRVMIMYAGRIVESGDTAALYESPLHPYTQGLMASFPSVFEAQEVLEGIPGNPPDMRMPPPGCRFHPRCPKVRDECTRIAPRLITVGSDAERTVACHLYPPTGGDRE
jgi:peptide/nickel transport system ATP-binding protein